MSNTIFITANWITGALSQQTISRQYDNNRYAVQFIGYPEGDGTEELDLYLLVWMSTAPGQKPGEITPIQLNSDQWYISNYFTQQVQVIKFQLCVLNEAGTYEAHSPIFSGRIGDSLEHNGTSHDIDVSTLFDAYREYVEELIIGAGAMIIDPAPTQGSNNAVRSGGVYSALEGKVNAETGKGLSTNDYSDAEKQKVTDATADLSTMTTATAEDVGKALKAKTVTNGKVTEWEFGEAGGSADEDRIAQIEKNLDGILDEKIQTELVFDIVPKSQVNDDGSFGIENNWSRTDYIDVSAYESFISSINVRASRMGYYREDKTFLDHSAITAGQEYAIPEGAYYLVISNTNGTMANIAITAFISGVLSEYAQTLDALNTDATNADVGKTLKVKTVTDGKVAEYEFAEISGKSDSLFQIENPNLLVGVSTVEGRIRNNSAGEVITTDTDYVTTDFIPVESGTTYKGDGVTQGALYASDKSFVSYEGFAQYKQKPGRVMPASVAYARFSILKTNISTAFITTYDNYKYRTEECIFDGITNEAVDLIPKGIKSLSENNDVYFAKGTNLIDTVNDIVYGFGLAQLGISGNDGNLTFTNESYDITYGDTPIPNNGSVCSSAYYPVTPGKAIFCNYDVWSIVGYDENKAYVGNLGGANAFIGKVIPEGVAYVRVNYKAYAQSTSATWLKSLDDYKKINLYQADTTQKIAPKKPFTTPYQIDGACVSPNYLDKVEPNMQDSPFLSAMKCLAIREINKREHAYRVGNFNMWVGAGVSGWYMTRKMLMDHGVDFCGFEEVTTTEQRDLSTFLKSWQFADGFVPERTEGSTDNPISIISRYQAISWREFQMESAPSNKFCVNGKIRLPRYLDVYNPKRILSIYTIHPPITSKETLINIATELLGIIAEDTSDYIVVTSDTNDFNHLEENKKFWNTMRAGGMTPVIPIETKTVTQDNIGKESDEYPDKQWRHHSIDQIFISSNIECLHYNVVNTKDEYGVEGLSGGGTNNKPALSDHDFVYADLVFKNEVRSGLVQNEGE